MSERRRVAILTRASDDNAAIAAHVAASGAEVIEVPCVRVRHLADDSALAHEIRRMRLDDWLVVTSRAGADAVAKAARPVCRVAAVGDATASCLERHGIAVAFRPRVPSGAALGRELPLARGALLARSDRALPDLPSILRSRGFEVREVIAYHTLARAEGDVARAREALAELSCDVEVYVASPSAATAFIDAIGEGPATRATYRVAGMSTARAIRERVPTAIVESSEEVLLDVTHR